MKIYKTQSKKLAGTNYSEVYKRAFSIYLKIKKQSKRRTYIRSVYFKKDKIFLSLFWQHLHDKFNVRDKIRRIKYYPCAIELIKNTHFNPITKDNPNKRSEILHRFIGITPDREIFLVQIKENKNTDEKYLISIFPDK